MSDASPTLDRALRRAEGYVHEAFLWSGLDELLARTVPFVAGAVARDEPVLVAVIDEHWQPLRAALGPAADAVDLALAVNELAANSLDHGGGGGVLRLWTEPGALVCEVRDAGWITDPLVGRRSPRIEQPRGRGVWMVHQLCDLVQIRSTAAGTVVRVHSWL